MRIDTTLHITYIQQLATHPLTSRAIIGGNPDFESVLWYEIVTMWWLTTYTECLTVLKCQTTRLFSSDCICCGFQHSDNQVKLSRKLHDGLRVTLGAGRFAKIRITMLLKMFEYLLGWQISSSQLGGVRFPGYIVLLCSYLVNLMYIWPFPGYVHLYIPYWLPNAMLLAAALRESRGNLASAFAELGT